MQRLLLILICVSICFSCVACGTSSDDSSSQEEVFYYLNSEDNNEKENLESKELIKYVSKYEPGFVGAYEQYYSKWLNLSFDNYANEYNMLNKNSIYRDDSAYVNAILYYGGSSDQVTELEIINSGLKDGFIGIYVQDCKGKTLEQYIQQLKDATEDKLEKDLVNRSLVWEIKDDTEILLCNQKYIVSTIEIKELDRKGTASYFGSYTYWELTRIKDDKIITIHCSGISRQNTLEEMLSVFEEIGIEREQISFGSYEQDGNKSNGNEKIEWYILEKDLENKKALIISKKALSYQKFTTREYTSKSVNENNNSTYEESFIRKWLNTDFLNDAFSNEEKDIILVTNVSAEKNPKSGIETDPGASTNDKVFILSFSEFEKYFPERNSKTCQMVSKYVTNQIELEYPEPRHFGIEQAYNMWIRNPGEYESHTAAFINEQGSVTFRSSYDKGIVYPAMWINLE